MPSWISTIGPVLALLVALFALVTVRRMASREAERFATVQRWYAEYREEAARSPARLVCAWPVSERETFQKVIERGVVGAAVRNASETPIFHVELIYRDPDAAWTCVRRVRMIPPAEEPQIYAGFDEEGTTGAPKPERINPDGSTRLVASADMHLELRFTDGQGRRWIRGEHGELFVAPDSEPVSVAAPEDVSV